MHTKYLRDINWRYVYVCPSPGLKLHFWTTYLVFRICVHITLVPWVRSPVRWSKLPTQAVQNCCDDSRLTNTYNIQRTTSHRAPDLEPFPPNEHPSFAE